LLPFFGREGTAWLFYYLTDSPAETALVRTGDFSFHVERCLPAGIDGTVTVRPPDPGPGIRLKGRVVIPEGSAPHTIDAVIMRNDIPEVRRFDPFGLRGTMGWASVPVERDGSFVVEGLVPGRYAFGASLVEWGVRTDFYGELTIEPDRSPPLFELASPPAQGTLEIVVENSAGEPVPDAGLLFLDPVDSPIAASLTMGSRFFTDGAGKIDFPEMPPGRYGFVFFGEPGRQGVSITGRVAVSAGERASVKIVLAD
ncbi:MAG: carboxypeptidase-like regulatory domain-containing protein, partial [Pirellulales bacterium]|nr:carboxypeptidase-like regulatory domain-containing protein [Pirellulales bacterium]